MNNFPEEFSPSLELEAKKSINKKNGHIKNGRGAATMWLYHAAAGDRLVRLKTEALYLYIYDPEIPERYMYTYSYDEEENWTTFRKCFKLPKEYTFTKECYFRIEVRRLAVSSKKAIDEAGSLVQLIRRETPVYAWMKEYDKVYGEELEAVKKRAAAVAGRGPSFVLMSDSHVAVGGTWPCTVMTVGDITRTLSADKSFKGIIHLGDLTDGLLPRKMSEAYISHYMNDLKDQGTPLMFLAGNHDYNYFKGNPDYFKKADIERLYGVQNRCIDYEEGLRLIMLESFDPVKKPRYGFDENTLDFLEKELAHTPKGYAVLVLAHIPPVRRLHFWGKIRGEKRLLKLLRLYARSGRGPLIGYIHGHNHGELIDGNESFPIIGVGCGKCESFEGKKPAGSRVYERRVGTVSQEMWDVLTVDLQKRQLIFTRFGAGDDKIVDCTTGSVEYISH